MVTRNQLGVIANPWQGDYHKVLTVCSAGCLRSPTAAVVLAQEPYNFNTRSAGIYEGMAIVPVTDVLLEWADEIVCMQGEHALYITKRLQELDLDKVIKVLNIPDDFAYRDPELVKLIKEKYDFCE